MRIVCPLCSSAYDVPEALLAPGRTVRCAKCADEWVPLTAELPPRVPPEPEPEMEEPWPEPPPHRAEPMAAAPLTAMERLASRPAPLPRPSYGLGAAWVGSILVVALLGWGLVTWRAAIVQAWPASIRLYDALGLVTPR